MDCPACKEAMIVLELEEVEIDYCPGCGGIWLDEGELELLLEEAAAGFWATFQADHKTKEKSRRCPICSRKMAKVLGGGTEKIRVDKCKRDHGLWFDGGELEAVLAQAGGETDNRVLDLLKDMFAKQNKS
ncbi:MAG: hypothetical protein AMJ79_12415 [Phycisphaerae bacterium SM23_30]|nr:MAG: hypothetical protein AMJ79_12415 [Phycisphaerae bacterium SM23_30]